MSAALCVRPEWHPSWWEPGNRENRHAAEVCRLCPLAAECLADAVARGLSGVCGGVLLVHGRRGTPLSVASWQRWAA